MTATSTGEKFAGRTNAAWYGVQTTHFCIMRASGIAHPLLSVEGGKIQDHMSRCELAIQGASRARRSKLPSLSGYKLSRGMGHVTIRRDPMPPFQRLRRWLCLLITLILTIFTGSFDSSRYSISSSSLHSTSQTILSPVLISSLSSRTTSPSQSIPMRGMKREAEGLTKTFTSPPMKSRKIHRRGTAHSTSRSTYRHTTMRLTFDDATDASSDLPISATTPVDAGPTSAFSPSSENAKLASENPSSCDVQSTRPILLLDAGKGASMWADETQDLLRTIGGTSASGFAYLGDGARSLDMAASASAKWAEEALDVLGMIGSAGAGARPSAYAGSHVGPLHTSLEMFLVGRSVWWSSPIWTLSDGNDEVGSDGM
ncbi:hypothetical protein BV25DRAFT_1842690 [Artomyces pyxidatus]|uniref:Uncharacterized protein n=1 Tax=Artomyces pyxidatus TaxID=48021 RepID=A0ACB8SHY8_9AGAM|nr:hypothetical protein BV25DRAFT_1842690 [Artomyces pyxidatus]